MRMCARPQSAPILAGLNPSLSVSERTCALNTSSFSPSHRSFEPRLAAFSRITTTTVLVAERGMSLSDMSPVNNHNQDLFWALRGGNSNFGIMTRIIMETFD
jgi:hypothetical protein